MYRNRNKLSNASRDAKATDRLSQRKVLNTINEDTTFKPSGHRGGEGLMMAGFGNDDQDLWSADENIPASQEPTQRYLSQRSNAAATTGRTQSLLSASQRPPNTYFELVLLKAGVDLDEEEQFALNCDHITFVSRLRQSLNDRNHNFKDHLEMFLNGLRNDWSKFALKLLCGCSINIQGGETVYQSQDSMLVNFFAIDFLCEPVLDILLDMIEQQVDGKNSKPVSSTSGIRNGISLFSRMLLQLRYVTQRYSDKIYDRLQVIFKKCNNQLKREIIASADIIVNSDKHDDFAQLLLEHYTLSSDLFQNTNIETLTNLCLSSYKRELIRTKIVNYFKEDAYSRKTNIILLAKFLLKSISTDDEKNIRHLIQTLRDLLNCQNPPEDNKKQLELFSYIEQALIRSKRLYYLWQKTIAALSTKEFKSIDFIVLLLLIHIREDNCQSTENILRRHVNQLPKGIVRNICLCYPSILERYWNSLMQILNDFLRDKQINVVNFARLTYSCCFNLSEAVQKLLLRKLLQLTCESSARNSIEFALNMLRDLKQMYPEILNKWGSMLLPILDHIHEMTLSQTRTVMQLLISIAYHSIVDDSEENTTLQDQIDMIIKKQIINTNLFIKKQGIISGVQLIDCIARIDKTPITVNDIFNSYNTVDDLPDGRGKTVANYVVRLQSATNYSPELMALLYDELAAVCYSADQEKKLYWDKPFLIWFCELTTCYFQNNFIVEETPDEIEGLAISSQKCINSLLDTNTEDRQSELPTIAVNITELVLHPAIEANSSILMLCPMFNLMRVLQMQRYDGSLEVINALLGCAIVLPKEFDHLQKGSFSCDYNDKMQKALLDIYFHSANWLRVVISSFITQREQIIRRKILQRLAELVTIENKIRDFLNEAPDSYQPPQAQFFNEQQMKTKRGKAGRNKSEMKFINQTINKSCGKAKRRKKNNDNTLSENQTSSTEENEDHFKVPKAFVNTTKGHNYDINNLENIYGLKEIYRQLDTNILLLLAEKLDVIYPLPLEMVGEAMSLLEFRFILTDVVQKIESVVGIQKCQTEESLPYIIKPEYFMCDISNFIKYIDRNMKMMSQALVGKLEQVKNLYSHSDLFSEEVNLLKVCFGLCLRMLVAYFSWSQWFVNEQLIGKLKDSLLIFIQDGDKENINSINAISTLASKVFIIMLSYDKIIFDLKSASYLYQLILSLHVISGQEFHKQQSKQMRALCRGFLCRKWFNYNGHLERGAKCNVHLDDLVRGFLRDSNFKRQQEILSIIRVECEALKNKDGALKSFPNFKKGNFPLLFRGLCEVLLTALNEGLNLGERSTASLNESGNDFELWQNSCGLLTKLLEIVQVLSIPRNYQIFLKYSHLYLKYTLRYGIPLFEKQLRQNCSNICLLLKNIQTTTRFLHHLCCHSKAIKATAIVRQIPEFRETLETFVFRIKALLTANNCANVFILGNLKNKDIYGDDLISQTSSLNAEQDESDDELPEDDISVCETIFELNNEDEPICSSTKNGSNSRSNCY